MAETAPAAPAGFVARNNQVIGSVLSIIALLVAVGLGAGLMFSTETRGVRAILTLLTIAAGTFTLLLLVIGNMLAAATPREHWQREDDEWRAELGLDVTVGEEDTAAPSNLARLRVPLALLAIVAGLSMSVVPAIF